MAKLGTCHEKWNKKMGESYLFHCPGCGFIHRFKTSGNSPVWSLSGGLENPTVKPSILLKYEGGKICHLFMTSGKIQYLNDCTHELAGKTIDMVDW